MTIILGVFLLFTAFKMLKKESEHEELHQPNKLMKWLSFNKSQDGGKFFIRTGGKRSFTVLFAALLTIEFTDLLFALDSIPAIFAVTTDPFLVYSSNIFAILGLRSLYFFLKNMLDRFVYLKYSIFAILLFVSVKLMVSGYVEFPEWFSLLLISVSLVIGILVSLKIGSDKTTSLSKSMNMKKSTKSPNPEIKADKMQ
jgi:tellurite resistance protein TerC